MEAQAAYDYIVVGAGSSGCTVAARLAQRSAARVLLIEAGGSDNHPLVKMPLGFASLIGEGKRNWNYRTQAEKALNDRQVLLPRGRLLGGCSSINGMVYIRGQREDFDGWAAAGNSGWSYEEVLPLFKRAENYWGGESGYHGVDGPLCVNRVAQRFGVADAFIEAAVQCGLPRNDDFNGASQAGAGYFDVNIDNGIRCSSARAFLGAASPPNLTVLKHFEVTRVIFARQRAVAVEGYHKGRSQHLEKLLASDSVILSAGAFNTPKLLELSGIGCPSRLSALGIEVIAASPQVGESLHDHGNNYLFLETNNCDTYYQHIQPLQVPLTLSRYIFKRGGIFANPAAIAGAFFNLEGNSARPDTQIHFAAAASVAKGDGKLAPIAGVCASICQLQPRSRGSCHIRSGNAMDGPDINFNFLSDERECARQVLAVRKLRDIFAQPPIAAMIGRELPPLAGLARDDDLLQGIRASMESVHHPVGSCRMGVDDLAVTSPDLKVNGVEGLRIADASIMPKITSGNTNAACVMIGEKLADILLG